MSFSQRLSRLKTGDQKPETLFFRVSQCDTRRLKEKQYLRSHLTTCTQVSPKKTLNEHFESVLECPGCLQFSTSHGRKSPTHHKRRIRIVQSHTKKLQTDPHQFFSPQERSTFTCLFHRLFDGPSHKIKLRPRTVEEFANNVFSACHGFDTNLSRPAAPLKCYQTAAQRPHDENHDGHATSRFLLYLPVDADEKLRVVVVLLPRIMFGLRAL